MAKAYVTLVLETLQQAATAYAALTDGLHQQIQASECALKCVLKRPQADR